MSNEILPPSPTRRALVIWYSDETNEVELEAEAFSVLEVPELLRVAMDLAEEYLPTPIHESEEQE